MPWDVIHDRHISTVASNIIDPRRVSIVPDTGIHLIVEVFKSRQKAKETIGVDALWIGQDEIERVVVFRENAREDWEETASKCALYEVIWKPETYRTAEGPTRAKHIIAPLTMGHAMLREILRGSDFHVFVERYLAACKEYPTSLVRLGTFRV